MREALENGKSIGKYLITKKLSEGGSCLTYLCLVQQGGKHAVVIKEYYPQDLADCLFRDSEGSVEPIEESMRSFLKREIECRAEEESRKNDEIHFHDGKQNNVPGTYRFEIIPADETGFKGIAVYAKMETAAGSILPEWIKTHNIHEKILLCTSIAKKLQEQFHCRGYVHLDLRPENIFVEESFDQRIVILDYEYQTYVCNGKLKGEMKAYPYSQDFSCTELKQLKKEQDEVRRKRGQLVFGSLSQSDSIIKAEEQVKSAGFSIDTYSIVAIFRWMMEKEEIPPYLLTPMERFIAKGTAEAEQRFQSVEELVIEMLRLLEAYNLKGFDPEVLKYNAYSFEKNREIDPDLLCEVRIGEKRYVNTKEAVFEVLLSKKEEKTSCMIITAPDGGSGKTFALHSCAKDFYFEENIYPFFIPVMELEKESVLEYIAQAYAKYNEPLTQQELQQRFFSCAKIISHQKGLILLLVDGLDELPIERQAEICKNIEKMLRQAKNLNYNNIKIVLSTRYPNALRAVLQGVEGVLQKLPKSRFLKEESTYWSQFPMPLTPLLIVLLQEITGKKLANMSDYEMENMNIENVFELMKSYFTALRNREKASGKWKYSVLLPYIAYETRGNGFFTEHKFNELFEESSESYRRFIQILSSLPEGCFFSEGIEGKARFFKAEALSTGLITRSVTGRYHFDHAHKKNFLSAFYMKQRASYDEDERDRILLEMIQNTAYYDENNIQRKDLKSIDSSLSEAEFFFYLLFDGFAEDMEELGETEQDVYLCKLVELGLNLAYFLENEQSYALSKKLDVLLDCYKERGLNDGRILKGCVYYYFMALRVPKELFGTNEKKIQQLQEVGVKLEECLRQIQELLRKKEADVYERKQLQLLESQCCGNLGGVHLEIGKLYLKNDSKKPALTEFDAAAKYNWKAIELKKDAKNNGHLFRNYVALGTVEFYKGKYYEALRQEDPKNGIDNYYIEKEKECYLEGVSFHKRSETAHLKEYTEGFRHVAFLNIAGCYRSLCRISDAESEKKKFAASALDYYEKTVCELSLRGEIEKSNVSIWRELEKLYNDARSFFQEGKDEIFGKCTQKVWKDFCNLYNRATPYERKLAIKIDEKGYFYLEETTRL